MEVNEPLFAAFFWFVKLEYEAFGAIESYLALLEPLVKQWRKYLRMSNSPQRRIAQKKVIVYWWFKKKNEKVFLWT